MHYLRTSFIVLLVICLSVISLFIYQTDNKKRVVKEDLIELSSIKYGLFNVDEWKTILSNLISKKIEDFELKGNNRQQMKKKISDFLYKVLDDFEERYYETNKGSVEGFFKNIGAKTFNVFGEMKKDVPIFTTQILDFLNDAKNKKALKSYLSDKLNEYADNTFAKMDYSLHDAIIAKYHCADRAEAISLLNADLDQLQAKLAIYKYFLVVIALLTACYILLVKNLQKTEFLLLTGLSFLFLVMGLTLPMIEIDARVSEISLSLLGEQLKFQDQVLYYKSKSILEVVKLMITESSIDLLLVGILVFVFSVLFPLSKLISSIYLVSQPGAKSNKLIHFLVFKTGKWSMADVMVVAIFMSYIGFSGILTEQLHQLDHLSSKMEVISTNKSSLQSGFFAFTAFALLSLLISNKLKTVLEKFDGIAL